MTSDQSRGLYVSDAPPRYDSGDTSHPWLTLAVRSPDSRQRSLKQRQGSPTC